MLWLFSVMKIKINESADKSFWFPAADVKQLVEPLNEVKERAAA